MKVPSILLNLVLVLPALAIPRIPPGDEAYGDPILQILYLVLLLPVMATLLNLILAKAGNNRWPLITSCLVCLFGSIAVYSKWVFKTDYSLLQTGSEMTFFVLFLASIVLVTMLYGILRKTGNGYTSSAAVSE